MLSAVALPVCVRAHSGPPFPIVTDRVVARVSEFQSGPIPTRPTIGSAAGQFWVMLQPARAGGSIPADTRVDVSIRPLDRQGGEQAGRAEPVNADVGAAVRRAA